MYFCDKPMLCFVRLQTNLQYATSTGMQTTITIIFPFEIYQNPSTVSSNMNKALISYL